MASANMLIPERTKATPYARRLARERGVALTRMTGSGPDGRITGADIASFAPPAAAAQPATTPTVAPEALDAPAAALAATVDLAASRGLLKHFAQVAPGIELIDICLKATVSALRAAPDFADGDGAGIVMRAGKSAAQYLAGLERLTLAAIAELRRKPAESSGRALVTVAWIGRAGVRPMAMPLGDHGGPVLTIAADADSGSAECLLSYDARRIDDTDAADFLLAFKAGLEIPLRLIA